MFIEVADYTSVEKKRERVLVVKVQDTRIDVALFVDEYVNDVRTVVTEHDAMRVFDEENISHIRVEEKLLQLFGVSHFSFDDVMGLDEVVDYSIIDIYGMNYKPLPWTSRFASTKSEKILYSHRYRDMNKFEQIVSIYMPFNTGDLNDAVIHMIQQDKLICNREINLRYNGEDFPYGPNGGAIWRDFFYNAKLEVVEQNDVGVKVKAKLFWNKDDSACEKETDLYIESDSGYIPVRKVRTDENGECVFDLMFFGLPKDHELKIKVGAQHFSAIGTVKVKV